jgi:hypothetical protein
MKHSSRTYVRMLAKDPSFAVVPFNVAANAIGVSRAAIERMLTDGRLEEIVVDDTRCVRANGVAGLVAKMDHRVDVGFARLEVVARQRETLTYRPLMEEVELDYTLSRDRNVIANVLDRISRRSHKEHGILLSVLVHRKNGQALPGPGFFSLARELGYAVVDEAEFVEAQTERVWAHYRRHAA